jgi:hypothetical protein
MLGSIVKAATGDVESAADARELGSLLLERELSAGAAAPESTVSGTA